MKFKHLIYFISLTPALFIVLMIMSLITSGASSSSTPIEPPCTPETAEKYGMICSELGAPWDLVLLADAYMAVQEGRNDIENENPLITALQFMVIRETVEVYKIVDHTTNSDGESTPVYAWVVEEINEFVGREEILNYGDISNSLDDISPSFIISKVVEIAEGKAEGKEDIRYSIDFTVNEDLAFVLKDFIGMNLENTEKVLELYDSKYIVYLYGGSSFDSLTGNYELPEITAGNVTRKQLVEVACSIIGHPYYLWDGKSPYKGLPVGPLDCSGYVDWVYFQCFEKRVVGGTVPGMANPPGTAYQFFSCEPITENDLKIGDLGFYQHPKDVVQGGWNHVGIYIGLIDGKKAFIHCGGDYFGYSERPSGRVGISINSGSELNNKIPLGGTFEPPMKSSNFRYFGRPQFQFTDDNIERPSGG